METKGLWQAVLGELEVSVSRASFSTWFKHTSIISEEDGHIVVGVPNIFTKEWLEKKYHDDIKAVLARMNAGINSVEYKVSTKKSGTVAGNKPAEAPAHTKSPVTTGTYTPPSCLNPKYTFDSFVVGASNELAYAASQAVLKSPGQKYNPLYIYGGVGLGKTHLMQAVGNEIQRRDPSKRVEYVTSEGFTNEFLSALQRKKTGAFSAKYRNVDVLIVDDIQFLASKERTVEEFFHTFNTLHQSSKQIIISSDKPPQAIAGLEDRLKSRFASGMMADISAPDLETRSAILQSKAAAQGIILPASAVEHLARHFQNNIRELEGALTQFIAFCELRGIEPSVAAATGLLSNIVSTRPARRAPAPKAVIDRTAAYFDLKPADITGLKRDKEIVVPRQISMYLMRNELGLSFPKISAVVGGRDHTTAMHSVSKIEKLLEVDENLRADVQAIKERLTL
ncbi:MAG TPA: chromosomal replication initiator protein DnaA [Candidatus Dormibacteraeota bacterium]|nr:chromosomal replication initiator protein DnaA [Candidatus Dormibacteraeota bacterium]